MSADEANGAAGLRLLRPLLAMRKKRLEASLRERQLTWCEDPSNHDAKYKRSRLRRILNLLEQEGLSAEKLAVTASGDGPDSHSETPSRSNPHEHHGHKETEQERP